MEAGTTSIIILAASMLFFISAGYALYWSSRSGQLQNFEQGAKAVFDEEEPEGAQTDFFPGRAPRNQKPETSLP